MTSLAVIVLPVRSDGDPATSVLLRGPAAIAALGGRLAATARRAGLTTEGLGFRLRTDRDLRVDRDGRVLAVDIDLARSDLATAATPLAGSVAPTVPYDETFHLHSHRGSPRVVYLDFKGYEVTGTAWNVNYTGGAAFTAEPYDTDGNPTSFSTAEQDVIQRVWQRVSEDYAPFDVDITTEEPAPDAVTRSSLTDPTYGTRLVVTNTQNVYTRCGCGGLSYVGVFDLSSNHDYYQPSFVFTRGVGTGDKNIGEAASHEIGHTLGLYHDGTATTPYYSGQGAWAPIMGVGYYRPITQWSRGEYTGANNTQDDIAVIQTHGLAVRPDDHGDSLATATILTGPNLSATGIIATSTDIDVFGVIAGPGPATFTVTPAPYGPNLDVRIELLDTNGTIVAQSDPPTGIISADNAYGLDAAITVTIPTQGPYYLRISGTGAADPPTTGYSNYASIGQYTLTGTVSQATNTNTAPVAVATATPTAVVPGQPVTFSAAGSLDPDGTITNYAWNFGDTTTATVPSPHHAYTTTGTYTATLTVTDNTGAVSHAATATINVVTPSVRVNSIRPSLVQRGNRITATALVTITDTFGHPVNGAVVHANWTGAMTSPASGITGPAGTVLLLSPPIAVRTATFTITIANVTMNVAPYNATLNLVTTATVHR